MRNICMNVFANIENLCNFACESQKNFFKFFFININ